MSGQSKDLHGHREPHRPGKLEKDERSWRERPLGEKAYPYLYLNVTYLKVRWWANITSVALLACVGVDEEGFAGPGGGGCRLGAGDGLRLVAPESHGPGTRRSKAARPDDHEGKTTAMSEELPGTEWQRSVVHFERNGLAYIPASSMGRSPRTKRGS